MTRLSQRLCAYMRICIDPYINTLHLLQTISFSQCPPTREMADLSRYDDHNYSPSIEECMYWAEREREHEKHSIRADEASHYGSLLKRLFGNSSDNNVPASNRSATPEKVDSVQNEKIAEIVTVTSAEREQAYRAFRTSGWISVFYLITTDILGPYSAPWAFSQLG